MPQPLGDKSINVREDADTGLNALSTAMGLSKVDTATFVLLGLCTLSPSEVKAIIQIGRLLAAYMNFGAKVEKPGKITLDNQELTIFGSMRALDAIRDELDKDN